MIIKKDYLEFFKELYDIELQMERKAIDLMADINNEEIDKLLKHVIDDERRHAKLVQELITLVSE